MNLSGPQVAFSGGGSGGGGGAVATVSDYIGTTVSLPKLTSVKLAAVTLSAGTWLIFGKARVDSATTFVVRMWIGTRSASTTGLVTSTACVHPAHVTASLKAVAVVQPTATTTYYLNARSETTAAFAAAITGTGTAFTLTGLLAVKLA